MEIIEMPVGELIPYAKNPRKNDAAVEAVASSIKEFGFRVPIVVDKHNTIIAGHTRLKAAKKLKMETVPVVKAEDLTEEQVKAFRLADNKTAEIAEWDLDMLEKELAEIQGMDMSAFGFDKLEKEINLSDVQEDNYNEEPPKEPKTKKGDIYKIGNHRLMCGDSTSEVDFAKLMNGHKAQMTVTSPPYGVGKDYETKGIEPWFETMRPVVKNITRYSGIVCWNLGDLYPTGTQFIEPTNFYSSQLFSEQGFRPIWIRIWKKQGMNFGVGPYHLVTNKPVQQYEYISAFSENGDVEYNDQEYVWLSAYAEHAYRFVKRLTKQERKNWGYAGIWEMATVRANKEHPAMYPVELPWRCIKMHSDKGDIVIEPFNGSGTTIIACEQLERVCYAMEKSPEYCDLAVDRWERFTGQKAVKIEEGQSGV